MKEKMNNEGNKIERRERWRIVGVYINENLEEKWGKLRE